MSPIIDLFGGGGGGDDLPVATAVSPTKTAERVEPKSKAQARNKQLAAAGLFTQGLEKPKLGFAELLGV